MHDYTRLCLYRSHLNKRDRGRESIVSRPPGVEHERLQYTAGRLIHLETLARANVRMAA